MFGLKETHEIHVPEEKVPQILHVLGRIMAEWLDEPKKKFTVKLERLDYVNNDVMVFAIEARPEDWRYIDGRIRIAW